MCNVGFVDFAADAPQKFQADFLSTYFWYKFYARATYFFLRLGILVTLVLQATQQFSDVDKRYFNLASFSLLMLTTIVSGICRIARDILSQAVNDFLIYTSYFNIVPKVEINFDAMTLPPDKKEEEIVFKALQFKYKISL